jgi:hypothetical protein
MAKDERKGISIPELSKDISISENKLKQASMVNIILALVVYSSFKPCQVPLKADFPSLNWQEFICATI